MEIHTILLAVVSCLSLPMLAAYWTISCQTTQAHAELLCKRDKLDPTADPQPWKKLQLYQTAIAAGFLVLLLMWGSLQCYLGDAKTTMDWVFTWAFAPSYIGFILVVEHFKFEDLLNSLGLGQRAKLRYSSAS